MNLPLAFFILGLSSARFSTARLLKVSMPGRALHFKGYFGKSPHLLLSDRDSGKI